MTLSILGSSSIFGFSFNNFADCTLVRNDWILWESESFFSPIYFSGDVSGFMVLIFGGTGLIVTFF